jgi:hypothetical protein
MRRPQYLAAAPGNVWREVVKICRDVIMGSSREPYVRLVLLVVLACALVIVRHVVGVPMPWGS